MSLKIKNYLYILLACSLVFACARKGTPSGGPIDLDAPILLKAVPDTLQTNVPTDIKNVELTFDEFIILKDFNQNFLVSPPIEPNPIVTPQGSPSKEITINFNSELEPETTYSLNFGQSIQDNNEGNKLPYFSYVFSTGNHIDSLEMTGKIDYPLLKIEPENLIAALYKVDSSYTDSLIYKNKPFYVAKADSANIFKLRNLKAGDYRLVAFNDDVPNLRFDPKSENFAFYPEIVQPGSNEAYNLTLFQPQIPFRFVEAQQLEQGKLAFYFEGNPKELSINAISHNIKSQRIIHRPYSDTLTYFFNPTATGDTLTERRPRLKFTWTHGGITDTIPAILYDNQKETPLKLYTRSINYVPGKKYQIEANYPLDTVDKNYIRVRQDTLDIDFDVNRLQHNRFELDFPLEFDSNYQITLYPQAVRDIMQRTNDSINLNLNIKGEREFGNLVLNIQNKPASPTWLKLYNSNGNELYAIYSNQTSYEFKYLVPGTYTFKLLVDENSNERYDTGDYILNIQPEKVYEYPGTVVVKAFWDVEETWILDTDEVSNDLTESEEDSEDVSEHLPEEMIIEKPVLNDPD
ncbi:hypothetical protein GO491_07965 [Flavobacteriaceae bacterium Ap0902]|nr:hypothetical protein [Flavobacteriaceae bacterium Ap0902]